MNKLQQLEEQLSAIQAQIDEMKKVEEEWPRFGDEVWTIGMEGSTVSSTFTGTPLWLYKLATGSLHRTEEEASAYRDWLKSPRTQARRLVEMCDGFDNVGIWSIVSNRDGSFVRVVKNESWIHGMGGINFKHESRAQAAINKLGEDTIKLALGIEE